MNIQDQAMKALDVLENADVNWTEIAQAMIDNAKEDA